MSKIKNFIIEQCKDRAEAASPLMEELSINGIDIAAGCDKKGIAVNYGIEKLAAILQVPLQRKVELSDSGKYNTIIDCFEYCGVTFSCSRLVEKELTDEV